MSPRPARPLWYVLDADHVAHPEPDLLKAARSFELANRTVKQETIGDYWVSTVFLGIDHSHGIGARPILFETMVFFGEGKTRETSASERYCTWDEAVAGHDAIANALRVAG